MFEEISRIIGDVISILTLQPRPLRKDPERPERI
jgi:hypothetical protein